MVSLLFFDFFWLPGTHLTRRRPNWAKQQLTHDEHYAREADEKPGRPGRQPKQTPRITDTLRHSKVPVGGAAQAIGPNKLPAS